MKITYATTYKVSDVQNWSGTCFYIAKMLENQNANVEYIDRLKYKLKFKVKIAFKIKQFAYKYFLNKNFLIDRDPFIVRQYAEQIKLKMKPNTDIVFSPSSLPIALLETKKKKIFYTDSTFSGILGFYDNFTNLCSETIKNGNYLEKEALDNSNLAIYSSDWAAKTAIENYGAKAEKVKIVPFGANLIGDRKLDYIKTIVKNRSQEILKLLFIGVEWNRKGGNLAVNIVKLLNDLGINAELHIIGIRKLPLKKLPGFIINHGFINKTSQHGIAHIEKIMITSHFLLLPTIADCTPIVYSEANSFGLPCITTDVGGIGTIIKDDINGKKFQLNADVEQWTKYILHCFLNKNKYNDMCLSSFNEYESRLNWNVAGKTIMKLIKEI